MAVLTLDIFNQNANKKRQENGKTAIGRRSSNKTEINQEQNSKTAERNTISHGVAKKNYGI